MRATSSDETVRGASVWSGGVLVALTSAVGVLVGLRSVVHVELPRLTRLVGIEGLSREGLGVTWSDRTVWPIELQVAALDSLIGLVATLFLAAACVATLNAMILLAESAAARRNELAVRSALGATPLELARMLLRRLRALAIGGLSLGLLFGLGTGAVTRLIWPGSLERVSPAATGDALTALSLVATGVAAAYLSGAWHVTRKGRSASVLRAGTRAGADPMAVFIRKVLSATHITVAGTVLVGALTLAAGLEQASSVGQGVEETVIVRATSPAAGAWGPLLEQLRAIPGMEAESLAAPGTLVGLGVRGVAVAECGQCSKGGMPAPLWNALTDHYAVAPGYFELAGIALLDGRTFTRADTDEAEPVILVNETFARSSFERGEPIGKKVRVGSDFANWYTVIGVVADSKVPVLGVDETPREALYMSSLQQAPRDGRVLLLGSDEALAAALAIMDTEGFGPGAPRSLAEYRTTAARPLAWAYRMAVALALLALVLAAHGVYAAALQTTRRRTVELAIRRAVGANSARVVRYVLGERLRITAWGVAGFGFFGTLTVAFLQNSAGMMPVGPISYVSIGALLAVIALMASVQAAREALTVEPGALME